MRRLVLVWRENPNREFGRTAMPKKLDQRVEVIAVVVRRSSRQSKRYAGSDELLPPPDGDVIATARSDRLSFHG
jgi:hypothetical protein